MSTEEDAMTVAAIGNELVAQERAALVTARLMKRGELSLNDAQTLTGLSYSGIWYLMNKIARVVSCYYDGQARAWKTTDSGNGR